MGNNAYTVRLFEFGVTIKLFEDEVKLIKKTTMKKKKNFYSLEVGDVVYSREDKPREIVGVNKYKSGKVASYIVYIEDSKATVARIPMEIIDLGYKLEKTPVVIPKVEELTMEQVCKELGREIKIKK